MKILDFKISLSIVTLTLTFSSSARAQFWSESTHACESRDVWNLESERFLKFTSSCTLMTPELVQMSSGTETGLGWKGGYQRGVLVTRHFRVDHVDCYGRPEASWNEDETADTNWIYAIQNPNLVPGDQPSYIQKGAPLTDDELKAALEVERRACLVGAKPAS